ncbi:hypothetical protein ROMU108268_21720 [Roseomonas mucosa]
MGEEPVGPPANALALLGGLPVGVVAVDTAGRLGFVNPAFLALAGLPPEALPAGLPMTEVRRVLAYRGFYGPGDPEERAAGIGQIDHSRPQRRLFRTMRGQWLQVQVTSLPCGARINTVSDMTAIREAEAMAQDRSRMLDGLLQNLETGVALYGADGRLLLVEPGLCGAERASARDAAGGDELSPGAAPDGGAGRVREPGGRRLSRPLHGRGASPALQRPARKAVRTGAAHPAPALRRWRDAGGGGRRHRPAPGRGHGEPPGGHAGRHPDRAAARGAGLWAGPARLAGQRILPPGHAGPDARGRGFPGRDHRAPRRGGGQERAPGSHHADLRRDLAAAREPELHAAPP